MAEAIGIASGLITLASFALKSSTTLFEALQSYKNLPNRVKNLLDELSDLNNVLRILEKSVRDSRMELDNLKLPLHHCGVACVEYKDLLDKCTKHSGENKTSFRGWAKLMYKGSDISAFRDSLATYKSTITIGIAGQLLQTSTVTAAQMSSYKDMIRSTMSDIETQLQLVNERLVALSQHKTSSTLPEGSELLYLKEEKESLQKCLDTCHDVSTHIDQVQASLGRDAPSRPDAHPEQVQSTTSTSAQERNNQYLDSCKRGLESTTSELNNLLARTQNRLASSFQPQDSEELNAIMNKLRNDLSGYQKCTEICTKAEKEAARVNIYQDIKMADYGHQVIVSTIGDLINAKGVTSGSWSTQWLGQMSDESLQRLSTDLTTQARKDRVQILQSSEMHTAPGAPDDIPVSEKESQKRAGYPEAFEGRHGAGRHLS